jgi:hypothetical protein
LFRRQAEATTSTTQNIYLSCPTTLLGPGKTLKKKTFVPLASSPFFCGGAFITGEGELPACLPACLFPEDRGAAKKLQGSSSKILHRGLF